MRIVNKFVIKCRKKYPAENIFRGIDLFGIFRTAENRIGGIARYRGNALYWSKRVQIVILCDEAQEFKGIVIIIAVLVQREAVP